MQASTTPAYETNRQQNGVPVWANMSEIHQKQIKEECGVNAGPKNTFQYRLSGVGNEMEGKKIMEEKEKGEQEQERERM